MNTLLNLISLQANNGYLSEVTIGLTLVALSFGLYNHTMMLINCHTLISKLNRDRPIDIARVHEGLPIELGLTPEEIRDNPELLEIFGHEIADLNNANLNFTLESDEFYEQIRNQQIAEQIEQIEVERENPLIEFANKIEEVDPQNVLDYLVDVVIVIITNFL
jgi:hypothetical protein